jgi:hypothetical protein
VDVATASLLDRDVDVLWVAPKAAQLDSALELAPADRVGDAVVVPLASLSGPVRARRRSRMNCAGQGSTSRSHPTT